MTLLPIVARELRVAARRPATYWTRFTFGVLAITVGSFVWAMVVRETPRQTGLALFSTLSVIAYLYSLIAGALSTADCVSEEKREGTLGLLFLTDLKSYDIVLGKLAASSVTGIYGLLAILPVLGVPLLLGGVAPAEFGRVALVCLNNLFLSLTLGLFCSALCKDERKAIGLTVAIVVFLTAGIPALAAWVGSEIDPTTILRSLFKSPPFAVFALSPSYACFFAFDETQKYVLTSHREWFYVSLAITNTMGWIALLLSMLILPRVWQDKSASAKTMRRRERWTLLTGGPSEARAAFRRRLLEINPFYWLAVRDRFKTSLVWLWIGTGATFWVLGLINYRRDWLDPTTFIWTALILHSFFKCWIAMEASRRLGADRRSGALELLLSTPLSVNEILRGQWLALLRQFGAAAVLICGVDFLFLGLGLKHIYNDRGDWITLCLAGVVVFVFDLVALTLTAMWGSLTSRKSAQAGLAAIARVCLLPWFLFGAFNACAGILDAFFGFSLYNHWSGTHVMLGVWVAISVGVDAILSGWALRNLRTKFRLIATQRLESRAAAWGRWLGRAFAMRSRGSVVRGE